MIQMGNQGGDGESKSEVVVEWDTGCAEKFRLEGNKRTKKIGMDESLPFRQPV